jgi:hypothetical protein
MQLVEVLFRQITPGDIRKIKGTSNDAATGGGARDLRYNKERFGDVLDRLFTEEVVVERGKEYKLGKFRYADEDGLERVADHVLYGFTPTKSRKHDLYLCQINKIPFMQNVPNIEDKDGMLFLSLCRMDEGLPMARFVTELQVNNPDGNKKIAAAMQEAIETTKRGRAVVFSCSLDGREY